MAEHVYYIYRVEVDALAIYPCTTRTRMADVRYYLYSFAGCLLKIRLQCVVYAI